MRYRSIRASLVLLLCWAITAAAERPFPEDHAGEPAGDGGLPTRALDWQMALVIFGPIVITGLLAERWPWFKWLNLIAWLWPIVLGGCAALSSNG